MQRKKNEQVTNLKNKIKRLSKGDFHIPQPEIIFPETRIIMRVGEGEMYKGSFSLQNQGEGTIRGLVYPSSFRVRCEEQGFDGNPVNISYTYDGSGLVPGHVEHGKFTIVCNGGEYEVAFTAIIEKPFVMTTYGALTTLRWGGIRQSRRRIPAVTALRSVKATPPAIRWRTLLPSAASTAKRRTACIMKGASAMPERSV